MCLPDHLPNQQSVALTDIDDEPSILSALDRGTMLLDYFELNKHDVDARQYVYYGYSCSLCI